MTLSACTEADSPANSALSRYDAEIDGILAEMTLDEKLGMLYGIRMFSSAGVAWLGIPDFEFADGPFGIREELEARSWSPAGYGNDLATYFPSGSALAATWSPELAYRYGAAIGTEGRLRGKDMLLGPAINIQRIPTGGRTYEYFSEDPFLSARLSVGYTKGAQDAGIAVCLKHFDVKKYKTIAVIGENATRTTATGGVGAGVKTLYEITPLQGLKDRLGNSVNIVYAPG